MSVVRLAPTIERTTGAADAGIVPATSQVPPKLCRSSKTPADSARSGMSSPGAKRSWRSRVPRRATKPGAAFTDSSTSNCPAPSGRTITATSALINRCNKVSRGAVPEQIGQASAIGEETVSKRPMRTARNKPSREDTRLGETPSARPASPIAWCIVAELCPANTMRATAEKEKPREPCGSRGSL